MDLLEWPVAPVRQSTTTLALRTIALAAIAVQVVGDEHYPSPAPPEGGCLLDALARVAPDGGDWTAALARTLRRPRADDVPLVALADRLGLTAVEVLAVALAAAVEDDALIGRAVAHAQDPVGGARPTLGLLAAAFAPVCPDTLPPIHLLATGTAVRCGFLRLLGGDAPLSERAVAVPLHHALAMTGCDGVVPGADIGDESTTTIPLPPSMVQGARRQAVALAAPDRALIVRGGSRAADRAVAAAIAGELGLRPVFLGPDVVAGLTPWLIMRRLLPVIELDLGPGERVTLPPPPLYDGPVLVLCGPEGSVEVAGRAAPNWTPSMPPVAEREALWQIALGDATIARDLARAHRHGPGRIAELGRLAHQLVAARGGTGVPAAEDVAIAARTCGNLGLDGLAQAIPQSIPDAALVVPGRVRDELTLLLRRCRSRDGLEHGLGVSIAARYHPGVTALFVGPSGAGKTMAAGWLATRLGLPLYRIDLASVTSKYIGETEKNLAHLLARAEQAEVVLLFDEADSLFGKRTDVKEANDRFANAQTNYLLQRVETFDGIAILTSNSRSRFDAAFARRLDAIVEFPLPGAEERRDLWLSHLGSGHDLSQGELNRLAALADLSGGHIRNAVLVAAVLADGAPIGLEHILDGLDGEYRKLGRQAPVGLRAIV